MKRFTFFFILFLFAVAFLLVSSDLIQAQRRDRQSNTQSDRQTRTTAPTTTRPAAPTTPVAAVPDTTEPDTEILDATATESATARSANTSAPTPASRRGVMLEFIPSELVTTPRSWAVLVGVNDYVKLANLSYCVNDIKAIEASLLETDFHKDNVFTLVSGAEEKDLPTYNNIAQVLQLVSRSAGPEDFVFIALSGHGIQINEAQYFCPSDMDDQEERLADTAISIDWIYKALEDSVAKFKLLVVDACRDNPFKGRRSALVADMGITRDPPPGIALIRSCGPGEVSLEDSSFKKGIFTHFLLEGLSGAADMNEDGTISFFELYMYTQSKTQAYALRNHRSQQNPYIKGELTDFPFTHGYASADASNTAATSVAPDSEAPSTDLQTEMTRMLLDEVTRLRAERDVANDRRIAELEGQIESMRVAPQRQVVHTTQQRPPSQPVSRAEAVKMVNQHNAAAPGSAKITGAMRQELIQHVQQHGAVPRELLRTLPNNRQDRSKATYR